MPLQDLNEHNKAKWEAFKESESQYHVLNGLSCPVCEEELYDTNPAVIQPLYPPQIFVHCENCGHVAARIIFEE